MADSNEPDLRQPLTSRGFTALATPVLAIRVAGAASTLLLGIAVGRRLGVVEAGVLFTGLAVAVVGATVGRLGLDQAALRLVGAADGRTDRTWTRTFTPPAVIGSALICATLFLVAPPLARFLDGPELEPTLRTAALAVIPMAINAVQINIMRGQGQPVLAEVFRPLGPNGLALPAILTVTTAASAMGCLAGSYAVFAFVGVGINLRKGQGQPPVLRPHTVLRVALSLLVIALVQVVLNQTNVIVLAANSTSDHVARYSAAVRITRTMAMVLASIVAIAAPRFAALHAKGDHEGLSALGRRTAQLGTIAGLPILVIFLVAPAPLLGLFGTGFESGDAAVRILAIGQFANLAVGPVTYLLTMTGREARALLALVIAAGVNLFLVLILTPAFEETGAALATAVSLIVNNGLGVWFVRRELGFWNLPT